VAAERRAAFPFPIAKHHAENLKPFLGVFAATSWFAMSQAFAVGGAWTFDTADQRPSSTGFCTDCE